MDAVATPPEILLLDPDSTKAALPGLVDLLIDAVDGGASVSFMTPLEPEEALRFWEGIRERVARGTTRLFVARAADDAIIGTVQLVLMTAPNQPHRAEIAKLLVHRRARRQGVAQALMAAAESEARRVGRTLLVLDTCAGTDAIRLYERLGWTLAGIIPGFALFPDGGLCDTCYYWKRL